MSEPVHKSRYTQADAPLLKLVGWMAAKKRNPVYMIKVDQDFKVDTSEGVMGGRAGDFVAYDPISGHVWPVSAEYVKMHYEDF